MSSPSCAIAHGPPRPGQSYHTLSCDFVCDLEKECGIGMFTPTKTIRLSFFLNFCSSFKNAYERFQIRCLKLASSKWQVRDEVLW